MYIPAKIGNIPLYPEHKEWKRSMDGYPIFYSDGICSRCKGEVKTFPDPWYKLRYQLLGYCVTCVDAVMGKVTESDQRPAVFSLKPKVRLVVDSIIPLPLTVDIRLIQVIEKL